MLISAPPAVQTMFVSVHPAGTVSVTNFVPNSDAVNPNGALAVGTFSAVVVRVNDAGSAAPSSGVDTVAKSNGPTPPTDVFSTSRLASFVLVKHTATGCPQR